MHSAPVTQPPTQVETKLTLSDAIKMGLKTYPLLKAGELRQLIAREKSREALMARILPKFELTALTGPVPDAGINPATLQSSDSDQEFSFSDLGPFVRIEAELVQPFYTFGKLSAVSKLAERGVQVANAELVKAQFELILNIKRAYYGILLADELWKLLSSVDEKLDSASVRLEELLKKQAESVTESDLHKMKIFKADFLNRKSQALTGKRLAETSLKTLIGVHADLPIRPAENALEATSVTLRPKAFYVDRVMKDRSEIRQLNAALEIKRQQIRIARADLFPSFFVAGQVKFGYAPGRDNIKHPYLNDDFNFFSPGIAIGLKQDLAFHRNSSKWRQAQLELLELEQKRDAAVRGIIIDLEKSYQLLRESSETVESNRSAFKSARSWLTSAVLSFDLGVLETNKLLESFAAFLKAKADLLNSMHRYNMALAEMSSAVELELAPLQY